MSTPDPQSCTSYYYLWTPFPTITCPCQCYILWVKEEWRRNECVFFFVKLIWFVCTFVSVLNWKWWKEVLTGQWECTTRDEEKGLWKEKYIYSKISVRDIGGKRETIERKMRLKMKRKKKREDNWKDRQRVRLQVFSWKRRIFSPYLEYIKHPQDRTKTHSIPEVNEYATKF